MYEHSLQLRVNCVTPSDHLGNFSMAFLSVLEPSITIACVYDIKTELESVRSIPLTTHAY
jgi:hypothetical protein